MTKKIFPIALFLCLLNTGCAHAWPYGSLFNRGDLDLEKNALVFDEKDQDPGTPASNHIALYAKDDSGTTKILTKDSSGNIITLGSGGSGSGDIDAVFSCSSGDCSSITVTTGDTLKIDDDINLVFGADSDWLVTYDEADEDTLTFKTAKSSSTGIDNGMFTIAVDTGNAGMTANQEVFEIGKGANDDGDANFTELFAVDEDGDVSITGNLTTATAIIGSGTGLLKVTTGTVSTATAGTDYQGVDSELTAIAGLSSASNTFPYFTGSGTASLAFFSTATRDFLNTEFADDQIFIFSAADDGAATTIPNCQDSGGQHINYTQSSNSFSCGTSGGGGSAAGWTDNGTEINLTTSTDNVGIGGSALAKFSVDGDTDETQGLFQGVLGQTADVLVAEDSTGTDLFKVAADGTLSAYGTSNTANFGNGSAATYPITFNLSGTDHTMTAGSGLMTFSAGVTISGTLTAGTFAGTIDAGNATSFEVPNGASITTDAFGEIGGDNDAWGASRGAIQAYDGTASTNLVGILTSSTCSNGYVPVFNTGGTWTCAAQSGSGSSTTYFRGVDFDATDDVINIGSGASIDNITKSGSSTFAACIQPDTYGEGGDGIIYIKRNAGGTDNGPAIYVEGNSSLVPRVSLSYSTSGTEMYRPCSTTISPGVRTSVILTGDGSTTAANWKTYYNNTECSYLTPINGTGTLDDDSSQTAYIGSAGDGTTTFDGQISMIGEWNRVLSSDERRIVSDACASGNVSNFSETNKANATVTLPLNECADGVACATASMFKDRTTNANDGSPSNNPTGYVVLS